MRLRTLLFLAIVCSTGKIFAQSVVSVTGEITANTTWTKDKIWKLDGFVYVKNGATLTIEPGTVIKGDKANKGTLIVTRTGKINANGNASEPIVFTSNEANPNAGDWGGVIILGKAPTNTSVDNVPCVGVIEGGVDNVNGDGRFGGGDIGGCDPNDNSGVFRYVRIEYPGIAFAPNNEINGLTMGGVGAGTKIEYVQVSYSGDDSYEWFGGTVNCKYLVAYRGLDDDFDTDNGYSGNVQFGFAVRDPNVADFAAGGASNGFESDNDATGSENTPKTKGTFSNITIVGPQVPNTAVPYKRGAHLRRSTELGVFNSLIIGAYPEGLYIDGNNTADNCTAGKLKVKNTIFAGETKLLNTNATNGFDVTAWFNTAGWGNQAMANSTDAKLKDPFNINRPDPKPESNSPVIGAADFSDARLDPNFFTKVNYAGAFGPSGDWTCGWTKWASGDNCLPANNEVSVSGFITSNTTWTADKTWILNGFVYVKNCATLTIEPGTLIKGDKASKGALIVTRCAKIMAEGTQNQPIVFTSNQTNPNSGDWGGVILLGRSHTNTSIDNVPNVGIIEGGVDNQFGDGKFGGGDQPGGVDLNDNSGSMKYVRIEYPGIAFAPNNEINGLTMGGVGAGTAIDHVQVSYSGDDSYEWFGGSVNCKHLIAYRGLDDDFDTDNGFSGNVQFAFAVRDPNVADFAAGGASNGFESDNDATGSENAPKTKGTFSNVTIVGPQVPNAAVPYKRGAHLRRSTELGLFNTVVIGAYPEGLYIDGNNTADNCTAGKLEVKNTVFAGETKLLNTNATNGFDLTAWYNTAGWGNKTYPASTDVKLQDPFNLDLPNVQPTAGSPLLGMGAFTSPRVNMAFFDKVDYIGAFDGVTDWTCGWAKFKDPNVDCALVETVDAGQPISGVKLYPTVVNDQVTLELTLNEQTDLSVGIYNLQGQYFGQPVREKAFAGEQTYTIQTTDLPQGFYLVRIQAGAAVKTEKMIVVR